MSKYSSPIGKVNPFLRIFHFRSSLWVSVSYFWDLVILKNQVFYPKALAVLSGSIVIIHHGVIQQIEKIDHLDNYKFSYLESDNNYVFVNSTSTSSKNIVEVITKLFEFFGDDKFVFVFDY